MPYTVNFTNGLELTTVADQVIDNTSSLSFVGKNYAGYGKIIADNFLHLMENFANNTAPLNPVEGQLWYDTTDKINMLKVFSGTGWNPAGSIKKAAISPDAKESANGDLWVNPLTRQLFMFSGSTWDLIGPQFSDGLKTGPIVETIDDVLNNTHSIMSLYSNNDRIAIISADVFTPKLSITGFETIKRGINLSTVNLTTPDLAKLWGTADAANNLIIDKNVISASNFLRSDVNSVTTKSLSIQTNEGISIGSDLSFKITTDTAASLIKLTETGNKSISFNFVNPLTKESSTGMYINSQLQVGIGTSLPTKRLHVNGDALVHNLSVNDVVSSGNILTSNNLSVIGTSLFSNVINVHKADGGSVILPQYTDAQQSQGEPLFDIGAVDKPFRNIYGTTFYGQFTGQLNGEVSGNVSGSATTLANSRTFKLIGDVSSTGVSFNGSSNVTFDTVVSSSFIASKSVATQTLDTDVILTYRPADGLQQTTKSMFVSTIPVVPIGAIFPYAGSSAPTGYLLCDGSEVLISQYAALFDILNYSYRHKSLLVGQNTFALPDLRGRFPLGLDNMDNNLTVTTSTGLTVNAGGNRNGAGNDGAKPAGRVHHSSGSTLGSSAGSEALGTPGVTGVTGTSASTTTTGIPSLIMNPYQTINYIIFTGVL